MRYHVANDFTTSPDVTLVALSTAFKTQLSGLAQTAALRRGNVRELKLGPVSNPAATDCNIIYAIFPQTDNGGTGKGVVTPRYTPAIEAGTPPAAGSLWQVNYATEPAVGNDHAWSMYLNQHSGFIWYAPDEVGVQWPALNNNGLAFRAKGATSDYTGTVSWDVDFDE